MFTPCAGFFNNRPLTCEGEFGCIKHFPNSDGQSCTAVKPDPNDTENIAYWNDDWDCLGIDLGGDEKCQVCDKAIVTGCDKFHYKERDDSCPGFGTLDIPMEWDGIKWISEWIPMGGVGTQQCATFAETPPLGEGRTGPPFCTAAECNFCGECNQREFDFRKVNAEGDPPDVIRPPKRDMWHMQLVMGCGSAIETGGQGLPTVDSYNETILNMRMNIMTCRLPVYGDTSPCGGAACDIEGFNCGPRPPCTDCCSWESYDEVIPAVCEFPSMYGMDPAACLNLQGGQLKGNIARTFRKEPEVFEIYSVDMDTTGKRGYDILLGRQIGGRACGWKGSTNHGKKADRVSVGLADRIPAETGGKYWGGSNLGGFILADADTGLNAMLPSSTDLLSASSAYPESTYLVEDIEPPARIKVDWNYQKSYSGGKSFENKDIPDPTADIQPGYRTLTSDQPTIEASRRIDALQPEDVFTDIDPITGWGKLKTDGTANYPQWVEIKVKDATKLANHNRLIDRHLYRGTRDEPWPYGDAPWPVAHQSEFNVPFDVVYQIGANFPGPLNNLFRVGNKPTKSNMSYEEYFVADKPLINPVGEQDPKWNGFFELADSLDYLDGGSSGEGGLHMNRVLEVNKVKYDYNFPVIGKKSVEHLEVTTSHIHDLKNGEKIWLDAIQATQGACVIGTAACIDDAGIDVTGAFGNRKKCEACIKISDNTDITATYPNIKACEYDWPIIGQQGLWGGTWHSGMIKKRKLTPDMTVKIDEDYCESSFFGICQTKVGILGVDAYEVRLNPDGIDDTIGITNDGSMQDGFFTVEGEETNAIMSEAVCLAVKKDQDGDDLSPIWTGPGTWVDTEVDVKGCVEQGEGGAEGSKFDFEDLATDPCDTCYVRCRMGNMFWNGEGSCGAKGCCGRDDYCPSSKANAEWVVNNVTDYTFTIHNEYYVDAEPNDATDGTGTVSEEYDPTQAHTSYSALTTKEGATGWNKIVPGHPMGHEVGIGPPAGPFGEFYVNNYVKGVFDWTGVWTRHGGLFRVAVGTHEVTPWPGMDCRQANTQGPVDLDFQFLNIPEVCCNIHTPVQDNACAKKGWPGYGPSSTVSEKLDGVAFVVTVTE